MHKYVIRAKLNLETGLYEQWRELSEDGLFVVPPGSVIAPDGRVTLPTGAGDAQTEAVQVHVNHSLADSMAYWSAAMQRVMEGIYRARMAREMEAACVMPSDEPRVLAERQVNLALAAVAKALAADVVSQHFDKPARTLPGALSEASGGCRLGGWGAVE